MLLTLVVAQTAPTTVSTGSDDTIAVALIAGGALIIGSLLTVLTGWLMSWQTARVTAKLQANKQLAADRRESRRFQRDTLLAVQPALNRWVRLTGRIWGNDRMAIRDTGKITRMGDELNQEFWTSRLELWQLIERVTDDDLRASLESVIKVEQWQVAATTIDQLDDGVKGVHGETRRSASCSWHGAPGLSLTARPSSKHVRVLRCSRRHRWRRPAAPHETLGLTSANTPGANARRQSFAEACTYGPGFGPESNIPRRSAAARCIVGVTCE